VTAEARGEKDGVDPHLLDPDYDKHGGFPNFKAAEPGPGFARFLTAMRRAQDLAVSANPDTDTWDQVADRAEELVKLLDPYEAQEGVGPANRVPSLPGSGSLLMRRIGWSSSTPTASS
jgi:hypothetical protein